MSIDGDEVLFDSRGIDDNYYDAKWSKHILDNKILVKDLFYTPNEEDHFYSLLYHALFHKVEISNDYTDKLTLLCNTDYKEELTSVQGMIEVITSFLEKRKYNISIPDDHSVYTNGDNLKGIINLPLRRKVKVIEIKLRKYIKKRLK